MRKHIYGPYWKYVALRFYVPVSLRKQGGGHKKRARCCPNAASEVNGVVHEPFKRKIKLVMSDVRVQPR